MVESNPITILICIFMIFQDSSNQLSFLLKNHFSFEFIIISIIIIPSGWLHEMNPTYFIELDIPGNVRVDSAFYIWGKMEIFFFRISKFSHDFYEIYRVNINQ